MPIRINNKSCRRSARSPNPYFKESIWENSKFITTAEAILSDGTQISKEVCIETGCTYFTYRLSTDAIRGLTLAEIILYLQTQGITLEKTRSLASKSYNLTKIKHSAGTQKVSQIRPKIDIILPKWSVFV